LLDDPLFASRLLCIAAVLLINFLAAQSGLPWLTFDPSSYIKCSIYLLGMALLTLACLLLGGRMVVIRTTGRLWLYVTSCKVLLSMR
jgi:hypothetical protein